MTVTTSKSDQIEKRVLLRAPRARVWHALADAKAFGTWFGVDFAGAIEPGAHLRGRLTIEGWEHIPFEITVEDFEPERRLSWRWHPNPNPMGPEIEAEPTTLVVFELEEAEGGTLLTLVESGFDLIPLARRAEAYRGNEEGWGAQLESIERYVSGTA